MNQRIKSRQVGRWLNRGVALGAIAGLWAAPLMAQTTPATGQAPHPRPQATSTTAPTSATPQQATPQQAMPPAPQIQAPAPLPTLTPAQMAEIARLLPEAQLAQGLRRMDSTVTLPRDNDGLVRATLDYARAVHSGRLDISDFDENWGLRPAPYDPLPGFADAVKRDRIAAWLRSLPPPYAGYDGLARGLSTYRVILVQGGWDKLAPGPDLAKGASGPRVLALRRRLAVEDKKVALNGDKFDDDLQAAVIRAQNRYGLRPSGIVSIQTLAALNVPVQDRVRQIMANMERWRWIPRELPAKRIQVNIAAAVMTVFEGDTPIASMKAVTGRPGNETPMLQSRIHSIVINPPWNVPAGIAAKELWPKGEAYLKRNGYKIIGTGPNRRLQQQAGPKSALGRYKFDFDNPYAVYLHDTPVQSGFDGYSRLASHGCVRLEKPGPLAELLLRNDPAWSPEAIAAAVDSGETQRVRLADQDQVAVFLLYWTAYMGTDGAMNFRGDPYGWDKALADKIEKRAAISDATNA